MPIRKYSFVLVQHARLQDIVRDQVVEAETVSFPPSGGLCFYAGDRLVCAVAPGTWQNLREVAEAESQPEAARSA